MVETKHYYKSFKNGIFLGLLPKVSSDFGYSQDTNSSYVEMEVILDISLATAGDPVEVIVTEDGTPLVTENDKLITTESARTYLGGKDSGKVVANGNDIEVWEVSDRYPNGVIVFRGYISKWRSSFKTTQTVVTIRSDGTDMNNRVYGNSAFVLQTSQTTNNLELEWGATGQAPPAGTNIGGYIIDQIGQTVSSLSHNLSMIRLSMARGTSSTSIPASVTVTLKLYESSSPSGYLSGTLRDTITASVSTAYPTLGDVDFVLSSQITLDSSKSYYWVLTSNDYVTIATDLFGDPYANGSMMINAIPLGVALYAPPSGGDMVFRLYSGAILTDAAFTATDPSDMVREGLSGYGGLISYTASSIASTGQSLDYTFSLATMLEIVKKAREFAGSDWYWFVDVATRVLWFQQVSATPDHVFILGTHITDLEVEATIENIINTVYVTGGPTAGVNLLKKYTNTVSLSEDRVGLARLSDNRIVAANVDAAQKLADNTMGSHSDEEFMSPITISSQTYDITLIKPGDTIGFAGTGTFVDDLVLQASSLTRARDTLSLTVGMLPFRQEDYVAALAQGVTDQQTLDNPNTPS